MSNQHSSIPSIEKVPGTDLQISKNIVSPKGTKYVVVFHGNSAFLTNAGDLNQTIVVNGIKPDISVGGVLSGIGDGIVEALGVLKKILSCTPKTTTTVNVGTDGKVTSIVTETTCVAN